MGLDANAVPTVVCPERRFDALRGSHIAAHRLLFCSRRLSRGDYQTRTSPPGLTDPSHRASPGNANTPTSSPGVRYSSSTCGGVKPNAPESVREMIAATMGTTNSAAVPSAAGARAWSARGRGDCFQVTLIGTGGLIPRPIAEECNVCPTTHCSPSTRCICTGRSRGAGCDTGSLARRSLRREGRWCGHPPQNTCDRKPLRRTGKGLVGEPG